MSNNTNLSKLASVLDDGTSGQFLKSTGNGGVAFGTAGSLIPKSDGVTINYDAAAKIQQAINGTDYEADFPTSTKVRIKSLAAHNLKVRII